MRQDNAMTKKTTSLEIEGRTTQEAIRVALWKLGVTRDKVVIKVLSEGTTGLYGMKGAKAAKVQVSLKK